MTALRPHLDDLLRRRFGVTDPAVLALLARTVEAAADGHAALDLAVALGPAGGVGVGDGGPAAGPDLATARRLLAACPAVHVVGAAPAAPAAPDAEVRPFVLDGDRLATEREYATERGLLTGLMARAGRTAPIDVPSRVAAEAAEQRDAVMTLMTAGRDWGVGVLVGGPGTGKTTTVAALVAAELAVARAAGRTLRVRLAAPTGRAAARMLEAVRSRGAAVAEVHGADVAADLASIDAVTVHTLLGLRPPRTRRPDPDPIDADLVVVDEASMLPLPLAETLASALRPDAQLVLVGDPDQLVSVETGSVLSALVAGLEGPGGPVARLTENHRDAGAARDRTALVAAVRDGAPDAAVAALEAADGTAGLTWIPTPDGVDRPDVVETALQPLLDGDAGGGLVAAAEAAGRDDGPTALAALRAVRLVCAHREGPHGVRTWSAALRARLVDAGAIGGGEGSWLTGEPVQVLRNERAGPLRNGDVGVVVGRGAARRVVFDVDDPAVPGRPIERSIVAAGPLEGALAVTVHRGQGSEYGTVVVILPPADSPLATRELLYTAITRARRRAIVVGTAAAVRACVRTPTVRAGSLAQGLAAWRDRRRDPGPEDGAIAPAPAAG